MTHLPRISEAPLLVSYLAYDPAFRGIGPKRAQALWDAFGPNVLSTLKTSAPEVIDIIGEEAALGAAATLEIRADEAKMVAWLADHYLDIHSRSVLHLARAWGQAGLQAVQDNPYLLLAVAPWSLVDRLAQALGIPSMDPRRAIGAIEATLQGENGLAGGHTLLPEDILLEGASTLLGYQIDTAHLEIAVAAGAAILSPKGYQPPGAAWMEKEVGEILLQLARETPFLSVPKPVTTLSPSLPFPLTKAQSQAVIKAQERRLFVLGGYAGSGKTTVLRSICDAFDKTGRIPIIITLSGRAAQRAREATGREAMTVAKFLILHDRDEAFLRAEHIIIVDEASMLSLPDVWRILRRIGNASLLMAGDPGQLAPIGFGLVFHRLFDVPAIPSIILDRVMRQSAATGIPGFAASVRNAHLPDMPALTETPPGVSFVPCTRGNLSKTLDTVLAQLASANINRTDIQIIAPTNREISTINTHFHGQALRNGATPWGPRDRFCENEPLIWTRNVPDRNLTNGSMGFLSDAQQGIATFDGAPVSLSPQDTDMMELAYAISVHKAQGSQWPCVVVPVFPSRLLDRSLLYTALTRAQHYVVLVGDYQSIKKSVKLDKATNRRENIW